jgi:hypothetical protein
MKVTVPFQMKIMNVLSKVDYLKNVQNFEIVDQQQILPAMNNFVVLP